MDWIQPKTDWTKEDAFDYENYNRVTGNLEYLHEFANSLFGTLSELKIETNKVNLDPIYARHMNDIENGVERLNDETYRLNIGAKKTYKSNGHVPDYEDYNRIESATLNLYNQAKSHQKNIPRLQYRLGNERGIRV